MSETNSTEQSDPIPEKREPEAPDAEETENPVLARLIEEVRNEGAKGGAAYDRVHNRSTVKGP